MEEINPIKECQRMYFITKQFQRTHGKRFENYVITRIWHQLNDLSLKIITQQHVTRSESRALTDLYFPQLGIHIEIDERAHQKKEIQDKVRELDIINATGHTLFRINVDTSIEKLHNKIDEVVLLIKNKKKELQIASKFTDWNLITETSTQTYIDKGKIQLSDDCAFKTMVDAVNCFGKYYKPKGIWSGGVKHPRFSDVIIWFPRLYSNKLWENSISSDENIIIEKMNIDSRVVDETTRSTISLQRDSHFHTAMTGGGKRIVFARVKGPLGDIMYRFKGFYELNKEKSSIDNGLLWERTKCEVDTFSVLNE